MIQPKPANWRFNGLLIAHLLAGLLIGSWWLAPTRQIWDSIDEWVAINLNGLLAHGHGWQIFWAITNARIFDLVAAGIMMGLLLLYLWRGGAAEQFNQRLAQITFIGMYLLVVVTISHKFLFKNVGRHSPSLMLEPFYLLSDLLDDLRINYKISSKNSFPGDHATVVAVFAGLFWTIANWRYGLAAAVLALLFILPRLVGGAHWLTDTLVGGGAIALIAVSWAVATPLAATIIQRLTDFFDALARRIDRRRQDQRQPSS
ncbi:MAG: phosphatase PAP2 family protein [Phycisphaerales bacterium]|nr:phosphatase PAP2 family protein [Phycisphaerales bacterium]